MENIPVLDTKLGAHHYVLKWSHMMAELMAEIALDVSNLSDATLDGALSELVELKSSDTAWLPSLVVAPLVASAIELHLDLRESKDLVPGTD